MSDALNMTHHYISTESSCYFGSEEVSNVRSLTSSFPSCTTEAIPEAIPQTLVKKTKKTPNLVKILYVYVCCMCGVSLMCV